MYTNNKENINMMNIDEQILTIINPYSNVSNNYEYGRILTIIDKYGVYGRILTHIRIVSNFKIMSNNSEY